MADRSSTKGASVSLTVSASGVSNPVYSASGLPAGLSINPSARVIGGTVAAGSVADSPYDDDVTVIATGSSASATFTWAVSSPVSIGAIADQAGTEHTAIATLTPSATDSVSGATVTWAALGLPPGLQINASSSAITGTPALGSADLGPSRCPSTPATSGATVHYLAIGLPPGLAINPTTGAITGTISLGAGYEGPYNVSVVANDGTDSMTQSFTWNVFSPLTIGQLADQTNTENDSVSLAISASDTVSGATVSYAALGLPPGLAINPTSGVSIGWNRGKQAIRNFTSASGAKTFN